MSKVEEFRKSLITRTILCEGLTELKYNVYDISVRELDDTLNDIKAEQEELQKKVDKYDSFEACLTAMKEKLRPFLADWEGLAKPASMTEKIDKLLKELDDPEKFDQFIEGYHAFVDKDKPVEVPQFVAEWYEANKRDLDYRIWEYIYDFDEHRRDDFNNWMNNSKNKPIETLIRMKVGYTVQQEQLYYVHDKLTGFYLVEKLTLAHNPYTTFKWTDDEQAREAYTEQQIRKHMGDDYMKFAVKVNEK